MQTREDLRLQQWLEILNEPDVEMSVIAAGKLADIRRAEAVPDLVNAMKRRTPEVAAAAAQALGRIGDKSAIPALTETLKRHRDVHVQTAAADSLGRLQAYTAIPVLKQVIITYIEEHKTDRLAMTRGFRRGLFTTSILALKQIGTRDAVRFAERAESATR
ncbi:HEAT repeat domain-containing protein [Phototrophicus methaneseepsis]|uniref:HEAT repeat domain-containing protein n=1 Tax=Phototrophicus methaneseepsis TaxID=2710758 RepID=A0A7S8E8X9_9CHLR|nr:HEAT repeat domain-containing protein [Phototrophicus methaneseepsis]QPC82517.1 HEAT repeat domain-containing protein [Phototrophicus methaneseepsis]